MFFSCDTSDGICISYDYTTINNWPMHNYRCWNNLSQSECDDEWQQNQTCEEFCEEFQGMQGYFCYDMDEGGE